jgi:deoxyadenosine/deoxycytidine kinase
VSNKLQHIAIAGNIGAGKTTLASLLAKHFDWDTQFEDADQNPYITDFYEDMKRWSFHMQIYYLNRRFQQAINVRSNPKPVVQDRTIYEDSYIFASNLRSMSLMAKRDFEVYQSLFEQLRSMVRPPDLLIYLRCEIPTLVERIQKRGRPYEDSIRLDYLKKLNERYENWIASFKNQANLLVIDVTSIDFEKNPEDLGGIIDRINSHESTLLK